MKKRELTEQEKAEWHEELYGRPRPNPVPKKNSATSSPVKKAPPAAALLEGRAARKQLKQAKEVEATLDLHGLSKLDAYDRTRAFLRRAQAGGKRHVMIVTGKGRGVLREHLPKWLQEWPELVHSMGYAAPEKGGDAAMHVLLRKKRGS